MRFTATHLPGAYVVELEPSVDPRGFFARTYCRNEFQDEGLNPDLVQCSTSYSANRGTLRGMHYQKAPHGEAKLVRCTQGSIYDVIVDLRPESPTFTQWFGMELSAANRAALYVPEFCAHGFLTLSEGAEVLYQMSAFFHAPAASGVRWNDPAFAIAWPRDVAVISERDAGYPDFGRAALR